MLLGGGVVDERGRRREKKTNRAVPFFCFGLSCIYGVLVTRQKNGMPHTTTATTAEHEGDSRRSQDNKYVDF